MRRGEGSGSGTGDVREALSNLDLRIGDVLSGKYRIESVIGIGGTGVVVSATNLSVRKRVALKLLARSHRARRFKREARAAARIESDHAVAVLDDGVHGGLFYIVMELLSGKDLRQVLVERGPLSLQEAADCIVQACHALAHAHAGGIVHRDLKPENLFLAERGDGSTTVKVLDFSHAKVDDDERLTQEGEQLGTRGYMSPEQYDAPAAVDQMTDIWSLGVILHELLTGRRPFVVPGETSWDEAERIRRAAAASIRAGRPDVPPEIEALLAATLLKDRDERRQRIPDIGAFAASLAMFGSARSQELLPQIQRISAASHGDARAIERARPLEVPASGDTLSVTASSTAESRYAAVTSEDGSSRDALAVRIVPQRATRRVLIAGVGAAVAAAVVLASAIRPRSPSPGERENIAATSTATGVTSIEMPIDPSRAPPEPSASTTTVASSSAAPRAPPRPAHPRLKKPDPLDNPD